MAALALCSEPGPWPEKDVRIVAVATDKNTKQLAVKEPCGFDDYKSVSTYCPLQMLQADDALGMESQRLRTIQRTLQMATNPSYYRS